MHFVSACARLASFSGNTDKAALLLSVVFGFNIRAVIILEMQLLRLFLWL